MKQKLEKWERWIEIIKEDISDSIMAKHLFWQLREIVQAISQSYGREILNHYISSSYLSHVLVGMRRQLKSKPKSVSLLGLLRDIKSNPDKITRDWFKSLFSDSVTREKIERSFDQYSCSVHEHVDPEMVATDIEQLKFYAKACETFADKRIAHTDKKPNVESPSIREIEECLERVEGLCTKYYYLLKASHAEYLPDYRKPNIKQIFPELSD